MSTVPLFIFMIFGVLNAAGDSLDSPIISAKRDVPYSTIESCKKDIPKSVSTVKNLLAKQYPNKKIMDKAGCFTNEQISKILEDINKPKDDGSI